jgi:hypothetical protein
MKMSGFFLLFLSGENLFERGEEPKRNVQIKKKEKKKKKKGKKKGGKKKKRGSFVIAV